MTEKQKYPHGWRGVSSEAGESIVKIYRCDSLEKVLEFSDKAILLIEDAHASATSMFTINAFECIVSLHVATDASVGESDIKLARLLDEVHT